MKEWNAQYGQHAIRVIAKDNGTARLYVDGELADLTNDVCESEDEPTLIAAVDDVVFDVFVRPDKAEIRANGVALSLGMAA
jgi:hypothetical protein